MSRRRIDPHARERIAAGGLLHRRAFLGTAAAAMPAGLIGSGAVQAARWSKTNDGTGFMHSFNGPHSLFSDTIRSCRSLMLAHQLGHPLMGENDESISLVQRSY